MLQSTAKANEHHTSKAVVVSSVQLPKIASVQSDKDNNALRRRKSNEGKQCLPPITNTTGASMMSILMSQRMEKSSSAPSDLRVIVYDSLEQKRAHKIGVKPLRNFDVTRSKRAEVISGRHSLPPIQLSLTSPLNPLHTIGSEAGLSRSNTLAPFTTMAQKPTCGYYFKRETLNKKLRIGVPPSDLVKWRTDYSLLPQPQKQT